MSPTFIKKWEHRLHWIASDPRAIVKYLLFYVLSPFRRDAFTPFVILCSPRTGSNLLVSYLNCHTRVIARAELCRYRMGRSVEECVRPGIGPQPFHVRAAGMKVFYGHPYDDNTDALWDYLHRRTGLVIIHLTRRNMLRSAASFQIALREKRFVDYSIGRPSPREKKPITIDAADLQRFFEHNHVLMRQRLV